MPGDTLLITFQATIDSSASNFANNIAYLENNSKVVTPQVAVPIENASDPVLTGIPADLTITCDSVPVPPALGVINCNMTDVDYPAAQGAGTTAMDGQVISHSGVNISYNTLK